MTDDPDHLAEKSDRELILTAIAKLRAVEDTQAYLVHLSERQAEKLDRVYRKLFPEIFTVDPASIKLLPQR